MKNLRTTVLTSLLAVSASLAMAQPGGGAGPGPMGTGMGPGGGRGAAHWGTDYTPGWTMMTPAERNEHRDRMRSMKSYEECKAYQSEHHERMAARAKESGGKALPQPRRDACSSLKK